jgi:hypothetical protein
VFTQSNQVSHAPSHYCTLAQSLNMYSAVVVVVPVLRTSGSQDN